jgi:hypothetical protein
MSREKRNNFGEGDFQINCWVCPFFFQLDDFFHELSCKKVEEERIFILVVIGLPPGVVFLKVFIKFWCSHHRSIADVRMEIWKITHLSMLIRFLPDPRDKLEANCHKIGVMDDRK